MRAQVYGFTRNTCVSARPHLCLTSGLGPSASLVSPFPDSSNVQIKGIGVLGERVERTGAELECARVRTRAEYGAGPLTLYLYTVQYATR